MSPPRRVPRFYHRTHRVLSGFAPALLLPKNSKKKNRGEEEQKRTEDVPVVPPSCVAFAASVGYVPSRLPTVALYGKRGNQKEEKRVEEVSCKNTKITEDVLAGRACPPVTVLYCCARVVPGPFCFVPSRPDLIHVPCPSRQVSVDGKMAREKKTTKTHQATISYPSLSQTSAQLPGIVTEERRRTTGKERQKEGQKTRESGGTHLLVHRPMLFLFL